MIPLTEKEFEDDPLEMIEVIASLQDWTCERSDSEISILANGKHNNYQISVSFQNGYEGLNIVCGFDIRFNDKNKYQILKLVSSINSQIWLGHFDIWDKDGLIVYRNSSVLGKNNITHDFIQQMLLDAINSIDRYFPAFQYILWAGKSSEEALKTVLFETRGEA
ncbi:MAG: YbjN domain-containing protein [Pseudomonadota bacterium]|nr:YbjN domain-containing protein [Pseudomonadota bacterium]